MCYSCTLFYLVMKGDRPTTLLLHLKFHFSADMEHIWTSLLTNPKFQTSIPKLTCHTFFYRLWNAQMMKCVVALFLNTPHPTYIHCSSICSYFTFSILKKYAKKKTVFNEEMSSFEAVWGFSFELSNEFLVWLHN